MLSTISLLPSAALALEPVVQTRRAAIFTSSSVLLRAVVPPLCLKPASALALPDVGSVTLLPLQRTAGGVLTVGCLIEGEPFQLIVDTGSPYLVVPLESSCEDQPPRQSYYGCASTGQFKPSEFPPSLEQYGALPGRMEWLQSADVALGGKRRKRAGRPAAKRLVFGGADRNVMSQSGGALLGLIRNVNCLPQSTIPKGDLRPTAMEQLGVSSYRLSAADHALTLSSGCLIPPSQDALPLVDPRADGDGVEHICCRVDQDELLIDGEPRRASRPILCVFDSGLTGIVLSQSLVDELGLKGSVPRTAPYSLAAVDKRRRQTSTQHQRRQQQSNDGTSSTSARDATPLRSLQLSLRTERGEQILLGSGVDDSPLFYVQSIPLNWFSDAERGPHVVALGQCALGQGTLTVDTSTRRAVWEPS